LLAQYFVTGNPRITEHGPAWAAARLPFLGKTFEGVDGCVAYFDLLSRTLEMEMADSTFPDDQGFIVDAGAKIDGEGTEKGVVSVVGKARFKSKRTGKGWGESFIYRFSGFDEQGKIGHWEIWADPLSAWVAVGGDQEVDQDRELE
jgi:hypothetical protein